MDVYVVRDSLQNMECDIIVNTTNPQLELHIGYTSNELLKAAGKAIQRECDARYPNGISFGDFAVTSGGNLKCQAVYHVACGSWSHKHAGQCERQLRDLFYNCLTTADCDRMTTIAFPAIGTGGHNIPPKVVAKVMREAIKEFEESTNACLQAVKIVIHPKNDNVFEAFKKDFEKDPVAQQEHKALTRSASCVTSVSERPNIPVEQYELPEFWERIYSEEARGVFYVNHKTQQTQWNPPRLIRRASQPVAVDERLPEFWEATTDPKSGRAVYIDHSTRTTHWTLPCLKPGTVPSTVKVVLPDIWHTMELRQLFICVRVSSSSLEYQQVKRTFLETSNGQCDIVKIERIQNPTLYRQYAIKRDSMAHKGELNLWHGTSAETTNHINARGFDRGFSGKNATLYGKGAYFAVNSSYSQRYAKANNEGERYIYLCKVLAGKFAVGKQKYKAPPPWDKDIPHIMYDSVVDNMDNPTIFVVFADAQAYPEYLLTFR